VWTDLGLARLGGDFAHFAVHKGVDDGTLADVGVPDEADADVLLVHVQATELAQQLDERALQENSRGARPEMRYGYVYADAGHYNLGRKYEDIQYYAPPSP